MNYNVVISNLVISPLTLAQLEAFLNGWHGGDSGNRIAVSDCECNPDSKYGTRN